MPDDSQPSSPAETGGEIFLPQVPALAVAPGKAASCTPDGELEMLDLREAERLLKAGPCLTCHSYFSARRLGLSSAPQWPMHFDVLELFAFVRPAEFCLPTPKGLAHALGLSVPDSLEDEAAVLIEATQNLLETLAENRTDKPQTRRTAATMTQGRWPWGEAVQAALGADRNGKKADWSSGLDVWNQLDEWQDRAPEGEPGTQSVDGDEARVRLSEILGERREPRAAQAAYTALVAECFRPRDAQSEPHLVLAEAGTGIGKTAGYIAPASLWAEKNGSAVWISTFTKNLQRQIDQELTYLFPNHVEKAEKVVIRKGRENYLCLLNLQEMIGGAKAGASNRGTGGTLLRSPIALGLMARWAGATRDGDMVGGDFPAWLTPILTQSPTRVQAQGIQTAGLTDRRGECIYSACTHYRKCFIERAVRKARRADIVIANHALVMNQAAFDHALTDDKPAARPEKTNLADSAETGRHLVFDEGHHLFDAADSTFAAHLTGYECSDLRRWVRGPEGGPGRGRGRGLLDRVGDLTGDDSTAEELLRESVRAAQCLAGPGFMARISEGRPSGPAEDFLTRIHGQVLARASHTDGPFSLEALPEPLVEGVEEAANELAGALKDLVRPLSGLAKSLAHRLDDEAETLDSATRARIDGAVRGLERRAKLMLPGWIQMLQSVGQATPEAFVDWFGVERASGRDMDVGMYRHWVDPTIPFAATVLEPAQGTLITSATLRDQRPQDPDDTSGLDDWLSAEVRTGAAHLPSASTRAHFASPFDYPKQTRILVVNDVGRDQVAQVAAAYRALFVAAEGGALGIFTAINRLRGVYEHIAKPLHEEGLTLYAQHVDAMDTGTLIDLFRAEEHACLLGTDAVRDGVDVPGQALRLIVFDRVPWPRPSLLHKARRKAHLGRHYDDMITRLRLKQAFGRLIRQASDRGLFVMLDARMPSRLATAFPEGVEIQRIGLAEAVKEVATFLHGE